MRPPIPRNRSCLDLVSSCELVLVRAEVIITDIHVKVKTGVGARLAADMLRIAEVENEDEDEDEEDQVGGGGGTKVRSYF